MARCKHGIELDVLVCEQGCGGTRKSRTAATSGKRLPEAPKEARSRLVNSAFSDEELRTVLMSAPSIRSAAGRLGCSLSHLYTRSKKTKAIWALYQGCAERGRATSRRLQGVKTRRSA